MAAYRLHECAKANRIKELEKLLDQGYHVDFVEGGFTALYCAVEEGEFNLKVTLTLPQSAMRGGTR